MVPDRISRIRPGEGTSRPLVKGSFASRPSPACPVSRDRSAFCSASLKVRPMAMASPTDFIWVVRLGSASGNFSKVKRGTFTTQ